MTSGRTEMDRDAVRHAGDPRPHVVIIGGGFAGIYAARALAQAPVRITLVDRRNHHLFQPMLYQVATAALSPGDIASPIRGLLRKQSNAEVVLAEVTAIRPDAREVVTSDGSVLHYDYLVCAPGARHSYFGHDEWEPLAPGLKSVEDATEIRRRILLAFERAERAVDPVERAALLTFVIVGAGPTGVELAGTLAEIRKYALNEDFRHIDPTEARVLLLEGGPRVLAAYPPDLQAKALATLEHLGVEVRLDTLVTDVEKNYVVAGGTTIPTQTVIWAAGNVASPILKSLGAPLDRAGRVIVAPDCTVPGRPEIFVLGDAALYRERDPKTGQETPLPGVAPVAIQMGRYAGRIIREEVKGLSRRPLGEHTGELAARIPFHMSPESRSPFRYWNKGQLAVIGRGQAVADIWRFHFAGLLAWLVWVFVHIFFLIGFRNRAIVLFEWAYSYFTYKRGAWLITGETGEYRALQAAPAVPAPRVATDVLGGAPRAS
ncbi:MAG TPA: NAD(P)/FAD-dependent oxidoreductase [Gemmatimonadales bacterium]|nr:NAD(P)/FAD-dependent oxidoreductase [Gemmatimonadales bacterium]